MNKTLTIIAFMITTLVVVAAAWIKTDEYLAFKDKQLKMQAIYQCGQTATMTWKDEENNSEVTEPYKPAYEKCLQDKGVRL